MTRKARESVKNLKSDILRIDDDNQSDNATIKIRLPINIPAAIPRSSTGGHGGHRHDLHANFHLAENQKKTSLYSSNK